MNKKEEKQDEGMISEAMKVRLLEAQLSRLDRGIIVVNMEFNSKLYGDISTLIDYLVYEKNRKDILIEINSPGGAITDGLAIYDKIRSVSSRCRVHTLVTGMAASMGAALLTMGSEGCRYAYDHSTIMIHQPLSGYGPRTKLNDLRKSIAKTLNAKDQLCRIMSQTSNISYEEMSAECDRDNYMSSQDALKMGLIDKVIQEYPECFMVKE